MKRRLHLLIAGTLLALAFTACGHSYDKRLRGLDDSISLAYTEEDLAHFSAELDGLAAHADDMGEADRMHLALLRADLQNKRFVPFTDDSLMRAAVDYYDRHGTPNERMHAYYLLAAVYRDLSSPMQSQRALHQAAAVADTADKACDFRLLAKIYGQLGELYQNNTDYRLSLEMYRKSASFGKLSKDTLLWVAGIASQTNSYRQIGDLDSVLIISQYCRSLFSSIKDSVRTAATLLQEADVLTAMQKFQQAAYCLQRFEREYNAVDENYNVVPGMNRESYYSIKGYYYLMRGQLDSALVFYYKELKSGDFVYEREGCLNLYDTYKKIGQQDSACKYLEFYHKLKTYSDSLSATSQLQELQTHFDVGRERQHTAKYKGLSDFWKRLFAGAGAVLVAGAALWTWYRRRTRRAQQKLWEDYRRLEAESRRRLVLVEQLQSSEEDKQKALGQLTQEVEQLRKAKEFYRTSRLARMKHHSPDARALSVTESLHEMAADGETPTEDDPLWEALDLYVDRMSPRLAALVIATDLNDRERRITQLVWAWFTPREIRVLLSTSKQNISTTRSRLHKKVFGEEGTAQDFDDRIHRIDLSTPKEEATPPDNA